VVDVAQLRTRYALTMALALAGGFLVVVSFAFTASAAAAIGFAFGIGILLVSGALGSLYASKRVHSQAIGRDNGRVRLPVWRTIAGVCASVAVWQIVQSLVFAASTSRWLTFADGLAFLATALAGLIVHELSTERVVHALEVVDANTPSRVAAVQH
jgi:uncharacterized membrane-anchored protein